MHRPRPFDAIARAEPANEPPQRQVRPPVAGDRADCRLDDRARYRLRHEARQAKAQERQHQRVALGAGDHQVRQAQVGPMARQLPRGGELGRHPDTRIRPAHADRAGQRLAQQRVVVADDAELFMAGPCDGSARQWRWPWPRRVACARPHHSAAARCRRPRHAACGGPARPVRSIAWRYGAPTPAPARSPKPEARLCGPLGIDAPVVVFEHMVGIDAADALAVVDHPDAQRPWPCLRAKTRARLPHGSWPWSTGAA